MKFIRIEGDDGYWLVINADQIEHARYRPANTTQVSQVEIMFAGNPERTFFEGRMAERLWELLGEQLSGE